jgi:hypothetical protein
LEFLLKLLHHTACHRTSLREIPNATNEDDGWDAGFKPVTVLYSYRGLKDRRRGQRRGDGDSVTVIPMAMAIPMAMPMLMGMAMVMAIAGRRRDSAT